MNEVVPATQEMESLIPEAMPIIGESAPPVEEQMRHLQHTLELKKINEGTSPLRGTGV
jgi:hypothetical protein